jgi:S-adenosyl methyltransferase
VAGECGVTQFLDIGSGLPTQDNVHQVAHRHNPAARVVYVVYVVYVDNDRTVSAHARVLLEHERTAVL